MPPQHSTRFHRVAPKVPNTIRKYRLQLSLTQRELATLLGIRPSTISQWERGLTCPSARLLLRLAKALSTLAESLYPQFYLVREGAHPNSVAP
ncbi:MAG: helix-turn-helix transcriptional regulator [Candidatus Eisenbacteria bacterium]